MFLSRFVNVQMRSDVFVVDLPSPTTTGFAISWLLLAIIVTGLIICYLVRRRNLVHRPFRSAVQCSDSQQGVPFVA